MKTKEIKVFTDSQLVHKELQLQRNLVEARIHKQMGSSENTAIFSGLRKDIARLRTEQRSREIENGLNADALRNLHRKSFKPESGFSPAAVAGDFLQTISTKLTGNS